MIVSMREYAAHFAAPGSNIYYSNLYLSGGLGEKILALRALFNEFNQIAFKTAPQPAQLKWQWWQTELSQLAQHQATHPITQTLQPHCTPILIRTLHAILDAFIKDYSIAVYDTTQQLNTFYEQTAGKSEVLLLAFYDISPSENVENFLHHCGVFMQRVIHLRDLRLALQHQRCYLSGEQLAHHHVTLAQLVQWKITPPIYQLLHEQAQRAHQHYQYAMQLFDPTWRKSLAPTIILTKIYYALLTEIEKAKFSVLTEKIDLTALRKWWISWRNH